jgi:hypothetical protein
MVLNVLNNALGLVILKTLRWVYLKLKSLNRTHNGLIKQILKDFKELKFKLFLGK